MASILGYSSGTSMTVFGSGDITGAPGGLTGTGARIDASRPNRVPGQPCRAPSGSPKFQWLNPAAWTINDYQLGSFPTASVGECSGPGLANTDFSVHKNFKVGEKVTLQFRMEFFNVFNKVQFKGFSEDITGIHNDIVGNGFACPSLAATDPDTQSQFNSLCPHGVTNRVAWNFANNGQTNFGQAAADKGPREIQYSLKIEF